MSQKIIETEVVVLGSGPGGYTAAFRSADLGKKTVLIERYSSIGGVCLNVGCIPSKALLHTAQVINEAKAFEKHGVTFKGIEINIEKIREFKDSIVNRLTKGLSGLANQRKVEIVTGYGKFISPNEISVESESGNTVVKFLHAIIAAGSSVVKIPSIPQIPGVIDSTGALELNDIPEKMLIVGGGIIGLEMATVYQALGSNITVVELTDGLIPGCDRDLVKPLHKMLESKLEAILLSTKVAKVEAKQGKLEATFESDGNSRTKIFDKVLVAVGRRPNGHLIDADKAGVQVQQNGFISVDKQMRTNVSHIFAIGDIVGNPMLAHKATHEGKVAAEVIASHKVQFDALAIPSVAYTDPEVAWMGLTETQAQKENLEYEKATFPWIASGRSLGLGRSEGLTKILYDKTTNKLLGAGIVGPNAGELIAEAVLALEMGANIEDISLTIHPHPTLSETFCFASEIGMNNITDLYMPKKK
ncbi:MAG: dihydrolipoyl dehydrogenase [Leptospiraceae bacterium]|nr:dihydrolipoyl dehydrogenase [Leptospiraceae bacterium]MCP5497163.1 dihydrolipoyl dehydrogenase [Leptospiraceae bacterium]